MYLSDLNQKSLSFFFSENGGKCRDSFLHKLLRVSDGKVLGPNHVIYTILVVEDKVGKM